MKIDETRVRFHQRTEQFPVFLPLIVSDPMSPLVSVREVRADGGSQDSQERPANHHAPTKNIMNFFSAGHGFIRAGEAPDASEANKKVRD